MKIAIIGSRQYENIRKVKNLLTELKQKFGEELLDECKNTLDIK